ncbi:hypothetical protein TVAG_205950 [Trichomonas vaginalis G3]|uniref:DNA mismatch repair protein HSM3 n=1 Tax=Trichomonas vaginalis (strain ATCC PRA-98 / G3) TaxID=412133 RepID=A2FW54_TRIV3|nr:hypothetical protein TVAGG3_0159380 [Trichomonas vaginalis G3]EAX90875.1 hypothetical protein TVAG_205950 [Trichomonas vaginalis G3]KAI5547751.1 hypothetical protein TVAGG3_0159380 [Trichomonas vaginalis G3]|eukprot:XP_001303805.1 hypothetical protein [Trichomonas vaginalis G3]
MEEGSLEELINLVSNDETTLETVLLHKSLAAALKDENEEVVDFLLSGKCFRKILKYSLEDDFMDKEDFYTYSEKATLVLVSKSPIQDRLCSDEGFTRFLLNFFDKNAAKIPLLSLHFTRILTTYLAFTSGSLLSDMQDIFPELIKRLNDGMYSELLLLILMKFNFYIEDKDLLLEQLSQAIQYKETFAIPAISITTWFLPKLAEINAENPFEDYDYSGIISALFNAVLKETASTQLKMLAFREIKLIKKQSSLYNKEIAEHENDFNFQEITPYLPDLISIYPHQSVKLYDMLFNNLLYTFLTSSIVKAVVFCDIDEINLSIQNSNVIDKINENLKLERPDAHVFRLARFFKLKEDNLPALNNFESWKEVQKAITAKLGFLSEGYGKSLMTFDINADILALDREAGRAAPAIAVHMFNFDSSDDSDNGSNYNPFD